MNDHEKGFLRFVARHRAPRLEHLMTSGEKGRLKLRALLANDIQLDSDYASLIPSNQQFSEPVFQILLNEGAPDRCFILSEHAELDGTEMTLRRATREFVGSNIGTFISCIPGKLGYYEEDAVKRRYLLKRS